MPHTELGEDELNKCVPPLSAPPDDDLGDVICDEKDDMLQYGLELANGISEGMLRNGRTRRDCVDGILR